MSDCRLYYTCCIPTQVISRDVCGNLYSLRARHGSLSDSVEPAPIHGVRITLPETGCRRSTLLHIGFAVLCRVPLLQVSRVAPISSITRRAVVVRAPAFAVQLLSHRLTTRQTVPLKRMGRPVPPVSRHVLATSCGNNRLESVTFPTPLVSAIEIRQHFRLRKR